MNRNCFYDYIIHLFKIKIDSITTTLDPFLINPPRSDSSTSQKNKTVYIIGGGYIYPSCPFSTY